MNENEYVEFKEDYTEKIYKEIISFLNTNSGTIYIGYDDNGNLLGLNNSKEITVKQMIIRNSKLLLRFGLKNK